MAIDRDDIVKIASMRFGVILMMMVVRKQDLGPFSINYSLCNMEDICFTS